MRKKGMDQEKEIREYLGQIGELIANYRLRGVTANIDKIMRECEPLEVVGMLADWLNTACCKIDSTPKTCPCEPELFVPRCNFGLEEQLEVLAREWPCVRVKPVQEYYHDVFLKTEHPENLGHVLIFPNPRKFAKDLARITKFLSGDKTKPWFSADKDSTDRTAVTTDWTERAISRLDKQQGENDLLMCWGEMWSERYRGWSAQSLRHFVSEADEDEFILDTASTANLLLTWKKAAGKGAPYLLSAGDRLLSTKNHRGPDDPFETVGSFETYHNGSIRFVDALVDSADCSYTFPIGWAP